MYDRIISLKIANPQIIINYGLFLEEHKYFEEAFRVQSLSYFEDPTSMTKEWKFEVGCLFGKFQAYEQGVELFRWPNVYDIWITYLKKFLNRYKGTQLQRARDLFSQCLEHCPSKYAKGKREFSNIHTYFTQRYCNGVFCGIL